MKTQGWVLKKPRKGLRDLLAQIGEDYSIERIDLENCLYRNFKNGFDVEISDADRSAIREKPVVIFLWGPVIKGQLSIAKIVHGVPGTPEAIKAAVNELKTYSDALLAGGYDENGRLILAESRF